MSQPPENVNSKYPDYLCRLDKAIYSLKQTLRAWNNTLKNVLLGWGFTTLRSNSSFFIRINRQSIVLLLIYVDNVIVTQSDNDLISLLIRKLDSTFALKDLWKLSYFLGITLLSKFCSSVELVQIC